MAARMSISRFSYLVSSSWKQQANSKSMMSKAMKPTRNYCSFIPEFEGWWFGDGPHGIKKSSWPEVVGLSVDEATRIIKQDMPTARVVVVPRTGIGCMTCDIDYGRVRLFLDYSGKVFSNPIIG